MRNLKLALRTLFKTPFVTAIAIVSLALGIGANAAIFSLFDELLLRPLPVRHPAELVNFAAPGPNPGSQSCGQAGGCDVVFSYPMFRDLERAKSPFSGIAAHVVFSTNMAFRNQTVDGRGVLVSGGYFPVLGIAPRIGRLLAPSDDQTVGANFVAVLGYTFWMNKYGGDAGVIGDKIVINGQPMTVVGVAPDGFEGTTLGVRPDVYVPLTMREAMLPGWKGLERRDSYWAYLFGRLKPGVTIDEAKRGINAVYKPIINDLEASLQKGMSPATMVKFRAKEITLEDGRRGQSDLHRNAKTPLSLLFGITGIVLLIACANIANLLLARAATRSMEMAVRLSLGASRRQLLTQLLTESVLLALMGGIVSILVAKWTLSGVTALLPHDSGQQLHFELHMSVIWFAAALSLATGFLFGLFPAMHSTRSDLISTIRANTGQPSGARAASRFRTSLVTAQIALSMALLISAGLFIKSLANISRLDLGLKVDHVLTFGISPELNGYSRSKSRQLILRVEQDLAAIPGVTGVAASLVPLLSGSNWGNDVSVEGFKRNPDTDNNSRFNEVSPGYFKTLGVPVLSGLEFTDADDIGSSRVAVVNEAFAKKFGLGKNAVGKRMGDGGFGPEKLDVEIVGLVQNAKYSDVKQDIPPLYFSPTHQDSTIGQINVFVRTAQEPELMMKTVAGVMRRIDPTLPLESFKTMPQQIRDNVFLDRMIGTLSSSFAALATLLAAIGLYGVLAYTVAQRTREIGVRMALGADGSHVRGMVLKQVGRMTFIGGSIGLLGALALGKAASSLLFGLKSYDPLVMVLATVVLTAVALGAGYLPARRASKVEPMRALRYE